MLAQSFELHQESEIGISEQIYLTNCSIIRHRGTFFCNLDELKLTLSDIYVTFKCSVKVVNLIILALASRTTFSSFRIIYPLRVHFVEDGSSLLFPHDEVGGVFQRDSLLKQQHKLLQQEESWISELPSCCQKTSGFCQPGQEVEASFLAAYKVIRELMSVFLKDFDVR